MVFVNTDRLAAAEEQEKAAATTFRDIGQILSDARQEQNLTIKEVANKIYVRQQYLIALEAGNLGDLPGRVYILGFIRNYARLLSLDGEELVRQVKAIPNVPDYERRSISAVSSLSEEGPNTRTLIVSVILVILLVLIGYVFFKPSPDVPQEVLPSQEPAEVLTQEPVISPPLEPEAIIKKEDPEDILKTLEGDEPAKTETPIPLDAPKSKLMCQNAKIDLNPASQKITVKAKKPTWVEIRDSAGAILMMKVLQTGQEYVVPEKPGLTLNTGNAGGIDIFVGGTKVPPLGSHGQVKRNVRLESLR
jgi:cytoskeleton protein RodZ